MSIQRIAVPISFLLTVSFAGCFGEPQLTIPPPEKVKSVDVMRLREPGGMRQVTELTDPERVRRLVEYIARDREWTPVTGSFPAADYTLTLSAWNGQPLVVLRIGGDWMGGTELGHVLSGGRQTAISSEERSYVLRLAGVPGI